MESKYLVIACNEVEWSGNCCIKFTRFIIEAEDRKDAERIIREKGYIPFRVQRYKAS